MTDKTAGPVVERAGAAVREELVRAHARLIERLQHIRDDEARHGERLSADADDRAQEQENDEVLARLERATTDLLAQYRRAIERIDSGLYGICETCGFEIGSRRLRAEPAATRCTDCEAAARRAA